MTFADKIKHVRATLLVSKTELAKRIGAYFPKINRGKIINTILIKLQLFVLKNPVI